jgi:hypothetical protein
MSNDTQVRRRPQASVLFAPEVVDEVLTRFASGETLLSISRDPRMPSRSTLYAWATSESTEPDAIELVRRFREAAVQNAMAMADDIVDIADDASLDDDKNSVNVQRAKLKCETRRFLMSRRAPALFGEALQIAGVPNAPLAIVDGGSPPSLQIARRLAFLLTMGLHKPQAQQIESHTEEEGQHDRD